MRAPLSRRRGGQWARVHVCTNWRGEGESREWVSVWHLPYVGARRHRRCAWRDRGCGTVVVWKDEAKRHCRRVWRDVRGEGKMRAPLLPSWSGEARHCCHLAGVWTRTEEGLRTRRGQEGGRVIACRGTDEVGEDDATLSSHHRAVIIVAVKWRWSYPHPIALWVTQRARARASLASSSLSSLLR